MPSHTTHNQYSETPSHNPSSIECCMIIIPSPAAVTNENEKRCRICLEGEFPTDKFADNEDPGKLICPCNCKGSIGFIHERCLKKQIISGATNLKKALNCEICLQTYRMNVRVEQTLWFRNLPSEEKKWIYLLIFLLVILLIALYKIFHLILNILEISDHSMAQQTGKGHPARGSIRLLSWLWIGCVVLFALIVSIIKGRFVYSHVNWKIFNREEPQKEATPEPFAKLKEILDGDEPIEGIASLTELEVVSA